MEETIQCVIMNAITEVLQFSSNSGTHVKEIYIYFTTTFV